MDKNEKHVPLYRPVISGERKQLGESVINEIESILDIDYQKLQIASIIQQGEINKIIDSQPKEFKELLNNMMGLNRLDESFVYMHSAIDEFRKLLRENTGGYDDNYINLLINKVKENKNKIITSRLSLDKIYAKLSKITKEVSEIEKEIEVIEPKIAMLREMKIIGDYVIKISKRKITFFED